ncbi:MAG: fused MFS/spermidine synthase [Thermoanaerobaculia bacterium]
MNVGTPPGRVETAGRRSRFRWFVSIACFLFSGASSLLFQTVWTQQFGLVFGASELAAVAVLAAFMSGLALGSYRGGIWSARSLRPLFSYGLVEAAIGLYALALPWLIGLAARAQQLVFEIDGFESARGVAWRTGFQLLGAGLLLLPPTFLMGASLPLLVRSGARQEGEVGGRIGWLYAANTVGAAAGALVTGFFLLPHLGVGRAAYVGIALNFAVAFLAVAASRGESRSTAGRTVETSNEEAGPVEPSRFSGAVAVAAVAGALALGQEIVCARLFTFALGSSVCALSTMLATFLLAIAVGTAIAARFATTAQKADRALPVALFIAGAANAMAMAGADQMPRFLDSDILHATPLASATLFAFVLMFPGAAALGTCFPLAARARTRGGESASRATGLVLAANTVGAVVGVTAVGLLLLPALGFGPLARLLSCLTLATAALAGMRDRRSLAIAAVALAVVLALRGPSTPWALLKTSPTAVLAGEKADAGGPARPRGRFTFAGPLEFAGFGQSSTVLLQKDGLEWRLSTNGLPESAVQPPGGRIARYAVARWLTLLPTALRAEVPRLLVVGLGAGHSLMNLPESVRTIDVVELEPEVLRANREISRYRDVDPLSDPRVRVHLGDARTTLALSRERFDAIVSQPSHPWTVGSASLFTAEFFSLVRTRLKPEGVFVQWIGTDFVDAPLVRSLLATLRGVFRHVECYRIAAGGALLFAASDQALLDPSIARIAIERDAAHWSPLGVESVEDVFLARLLDDEGTRHFSTGGTTNRDLENRLQTEAPKLIRRPADPAILEQALSPFDSLRELPAGLDGSYVVRRLLERGSPVRALRVATELADGSSRRAAFAWIDRGNGVSRRADNSTLIAMAETAGGQPGADEVAIRLLALSESSPGAEGRADRNAGLEAVAAGDRAAEVVVEAWRALAADGAADGPGLEDRLASVPPLHPLRDSARVADIALRRRSGEKSEVETAIREIDTLLARRPSARNVVVRAELGLAARNRWVALASLDELARILPANPAERQALVRRAQALLREVQEISPPSAGLEKRAEEELGALFLALAR